MPVIYSPSNSRPALPTQRHSRTHARTPHSLLIPTFITNIMPGIKTITRLVPTLLALAGTYAAPFQRRGMDQVISQCNHNFAYVSSLAGAQLPLRSLIPSAYSYTFDDGPYDWNTDLVKKFDTVGAKTTFCPFQYFSPIENSTLMIVVYQSSTETTGVASTPRRMFRPCVMHTSAAISLRVRILSPIESMELIFTKQAIPGPMPTSCN